MRHIENKQKTTDIILNTKCEWMRVQIIRLGKKDPTICCLQETVLRFKDTDKLKVKGQKNTHLINSNYKRARVLY